MKTDKQKIDSLSCVFPRRFDKDLPRAVKASGVWIEDDAGKRYLDAGGGALVVNVGHGREEIIRAVSEQMTDFYYVHGSLFTATVLEELAEDLARHAPAGLSRFYFMSSGSEAVETAVKLARQIHLECGRASRVRLISRWKSYHGLTLGALAASGRTYFREPFTPLLPEVAHIPPPYCLRCSYGLTFPACGLRCAMALEETILNLGKDTVSAFIAEPVSGATLGVYPPPLGYLPLIREICEKHGVLLIFDEVMTGMGRTGQWFASQHEDVVPDLMTLGKGLASGAIPLSAVAAKPEYLDAISQGSGNFVHGGTFSHHVVAAAAARAVIGILEQENLVTRADEVGRYLGERLKATLSASPYVLDVRGVGMMWGVELGRNKAGLEPFPRHLKVAERVREAMFRRGVLLYLSTAFAGKDGDAIVFGPPFIIKTQEIDSAVDTLASVLEQDVMSYIQ
ncbi:MAG: aspartate aminotransferase family protein [Desulfomonilaceae bacterium]